MSYTRPPFDAADASWQGATAYTRPAFDAADASFAPPATAGSQIKVWISGAWVLKPLKRWDGSAWVPAILKRWTGSAWATV